MLEGKCATWQKSQLIETRCDESYLILVKQPVKMRGLFPKEMALMISDCVKYHENTTRAVWIIRKPLKGKGTVARKVTSKEKQEIWL